VHERVTSPTWYACLLLHVQFDVTFPKMPCSWLSLDAMDISGEMHLDVVSCPQQLSALQHNTLLQGGHSLQQ
jgi:hypothetical protein